MRSRLCSRPQLLAHNNMHLHSESHFSVILRECFSSFKYSYDCFAAVERITGFSTCTDLCIVVAHPPPVDAMPTKYFISTKWNFIYICDYALLVYCRLSDSKVMRKIEEKIKMFRLTCVSASCLYLSCYMFCDY